MKIQKKIESIFRDITQWNCVNNVIEYNNVYHINFISIKVKKNCIDIN